MDTTFTLTVNGQPRTVTTDPQRPLLQVLREDLKLTGPKYGCGEGQCGACTVLIDGQARAFLHAPRQGRRRQSHHDHRGPGHGRQTASRCRRRSWRRARCNAAYCTSGMILSTVALLNEKPKPTDAEILSWMNAQICRCCGYPRILKAVQPRGGASQEVNP